MFYIFYSFYTGAPFVPTDKKRTDKMIYLSNLKSGEKALDLGSGDGRIVFTAAKTGADCLGIEINPILCYWSKLNAFVRGVKNVSFQCTNFWQYDLDHIDVLFMYFINTKMQEMSKKIKKEMRPGSRVISHGFTFPDWQYKEKNDNIYLYIV